MDAASQQATAVIREGDPSQSRQNNTDVKADAADTAKKSEGTSKVKEVSKGTERKKSHGGKKKKSNTGDSKDKRKNKKKVITTGSSSDSTDESTDDSDSESEADEKSTVFHKRAVKKPQNTHKAKLADKVKHISLSQAAAETDSELSDSSSDTEEEEEEDDDPVPTSRNSKNTNAQSERLNPGEVMLELKRLRGLIQQTQIQQQNGGMGAVFGGAGGLGGTAGFDGGLYANIPGRSAWGTYPPPPVQHAALRTIPPARSAGLDEPQDAAADPLARLLGNPKSAKNANRGSTSKSTVPKKLDYKRVDQVWDNTLHNFKLQDTAKAAAETKYDGFCFHVRRTFDWEGKYKTTVVDIKNKLLRECLQDVIGNIKGVSLVDETPKIDPNVLFL